MHRDYAPRGVKFFYIYKYLAHAGREGVVQPFTLQERLQHIESANQSLGTQIPWLCDTMDNDCDELVDLDDLTVDPTETPAASATAFVVVAW